LLLERVIVAPAAGAGRASNTVPVVDAPPVNVVKAAVTCNANGACRLSIALNPPQGEALTALTDAPTKLINAFTVRLIGAEVCPAATVTVPRVVPFATSCTGYPPAGAALPSVTVPLKVPLPGTGNAIDASSESPVTHGGFIVRFAVTVFDDEAVMVTDWVVATALVVTVKVADVWPEGIDTTPGTLTPDAFADRLTFTPAEPAGALSETVPVTEGPPVTVEGFTVTLPIVP